MVLNNYLGQNISYMYSELFENSNEAYEFQKIEDKAEIKELLTKYVEKYFNGFWETLKEISKSCGVKDLKVIPFSVGNVVAKQLCEYNGKYASLVINNICKKSESTGRSFLDFLRG